MKSAINNTIIRFGFDLHSTVEIFEIPEGAEILTFGCDSMRAGLPTVWFACKIDMKNEKRVFVRLQTGQESPYTPTDLHYIGTAVALGKSNTNAALSMTPRTVFYFEATGDTKDLLVQLHEAVVEA